MKTLDEMIEVMQAFKNGQPIECKLLCQPNWQDTTDPRWNWRDFDYRIAVRKPSIDWTAINDKYIYLAVDGDGTVWLYSKRPILTDERVFWCHPDGVGKLADDLFASFDRGTCDWRDSLICRPGFE